MMASRIVSQAEWLTARKALLAKEKALTHAREDLAAARRDGGIFHTYSCYSRGLDRLNPAYQLLDLVPKGRDEAGLAHPMAWLKLRDQY